MLAVVMVMMMMVMVEEEGVAAIPGEQVGIAVKAETTIAETPVETTVTKIPATETTVTETPVETTVTKIPATETTVTEPSPTEIISAS